MKKVLLIIGGLILIGACYIGYQINSDLNELFDGHKSEHKIDDPNFTLISDSISPNGEFTYYAYQFNQGGLGYSRAYWSVIKNKPLNKGLEKGILPDGYKAIGWSNSNELIILKWKPYYYKQKTIDLNTGDNFNGVKIIIKNN